MLFSRIFHSPATRSFGYGKYFFKVNLICKFIYLFFISPFPVLVLSVALLLLARSAPRDKRQKLNSRKKKKKLIKIFLCFSLCFGLCTLLSRDPLSNFNILFSVSVVLSVFDVFQQRARGVILTTGERYFETLFLLTSATMTLKQDLNSIKKLFHKSICLSTQNFVQVLS